MPQVKYFRVYGMDCLQSSSIALQIQMGSRQRPNSYDFISQMPDDVLIKILSLMPIKDAVATSGVATRWTYLWRNLRQLNFDGRETSLSKTDDVSDLVESERKKYIKQVNSVIRSYDHPTVNEFRIRYGFNRNHKHDIDDWLDFAVKRKVEFLELDLTDRCRYMFLDGEDYNFPSRLYIRRIPRCFPGVVVVLRYLKKLILKRVNVTKEIFQQFLKNSKQLEMISIHDPLYLDHIHVGGQARNLKHFEIVDMCYVRSIYLSDLDLVSFSFNGYRIDLRLANLPKLKDFELDMGLLNINNLFGQMSSCALSLQSLSITVNQPEGYLILESVPKLPNVKKLRLAVGGSGNDCLLFLASIMNACPKLETFSIKPCWTSPIISRKKARGATNPHKHLKLVEIVEYEGRKCDFELVSYIIHTAVALNKVVIAISRDWMKEKAARSSAERIKSIKPQRVELVII